MTNPKEATMTPSYHVRGTAVIMRCHGPSANDRSGTAQQTEREEYVMATLPDVDTAWLMRDRAEAALLLPVDIERILRGERTQPNF